MKVKLTLSANAGLCVEFGGKTVWIDALHEGSPLGFSGVDQSLEERILEGGFAAPDAIAFTHRHKDHYSAELLDLAQNRYPDARILPLDSAGTYDLEDVQIRFIPLIHAGDEYASFTHHGIVVSAHGKTVLVGGDCRVAEPSLAGLEPDVAVLTFPWLTLPRGRDFINRQLRPKHTVFYHVPFAADDLNAYRSLAQRAADRYGALILAQPLQTVTFEI